MNEDEREEQGHEAKVIGDRPRSAEDDGEEKRHGKHGHHEPQGYAHPAEPRNGVGVDLAGIGNIEPLAAAGDPHHDRRGYRAHDERKYAGRSKEDYVSHSSRRIRWFGKGVNSDQGISFPAGT